VKLIPFEEIIKMGK
jgi:long-chain acyl-CoA synthetase